MPVRFQIKEGIFQVAQSYDFPTVYLDHWALNRFSSDTALKSRFIKLLKASKGTLVFSDNNLTEISGINDLEHVSRVANFLEELLPNIYFANFSIDNYIAQENKSNGGVRLPAIPDVELLREVARLRKNDEHIFSIKELIENIGFHRDRLISTWTEINQEFADCINNMRLESQFLNQAKNFKSHPQNLPTLAVMQEMLRQIFLDKKHFISRNDAADIKHAIISIAYCDYVLLDKKWEDVHGRMLKRFNTLGLNMHVAKVFSERRQGVELFLNELES